MAGGQNRLDQAMRLAGGGAPSSSASVPGSTTPGIATLGQPFTDAEAAANPWLRTAYRQQIVVDDKTQVTFAKSQAAAIEKSVSLTGSASPDMVPAAATVLQIAARNPENQELAEAATKMRGAITGGPLGFAGAGMPDHGTALMSQAEDLARNGDPFGNSLFEHLKAGIKQGDDLIKSDHFEYARQAGWIQQHPPLDLNPQTMQQSMVQRGLAAAKIGGKLQVDGVSVFAQDELPRIKDLMQNGGADQRVAFARALMSANMSAPVLRETMRQLGADPSTSPLAVAGDVARSDPVTAHAIVVGQAQLQAEPKLAPKDDIREEFAKALPFNDLQDGVTRQAYEAAVKALYANKSAQAGDVTGVLDDRRMSDSVEGATGGIREWRNSKIFAPWPGATQEMVDGAVRSLTDADLKNTVGSDGKSLPASYLRPSMSGIFSSSNRFRLESTEGDGKYLIFSGPDQASQRQYLYDRTTSKKFVLDLGAKRQQVEDQLAGQLSPHPFSDIPYWNTRAIGGPM